MGERMNRFWKDPTQGVSFLALPLHSCSVDQTALSLLTALEMSWTVKTHRTSLEVQMDQKWTRNPPDKAAPRYGSEEGPLQKPLSRLVVGEKCTERRQEEDLVVQQPQQEQWQALLQPQMQPMLLMAITSLHPPTTFHRLLATQLLLHLPVPFTVCMQEVLTPLLGPALSLLALWRHRPLLHLRTAKALCLTPKTQVYNSAGNFSRTFTFICTHHIIIFNVHPVMVFVCSNYSFG